MSRLITSLSTAAVLVLASSTFAAVTPVTETFATSAHGWLNSSSTAATYVASGGTGGANDGYITGTGTFSSSPTSPAIVFRANSSAVTTTPTASGNAFFGDYNAGDIHYISFDVRTNYTGTVDFGVRFATSNNFPGRNVYVPATFDGTSSDWTHLVIPFYYGAPNSIAEGPDSQAAYDSVLSSVGRLQIFALTPTGAAGQTFSLDVDNVAIAVPEASSMALALPAFALLRRRRA